MLWSIALKKSLEFFRVVLFALVGCLSLNPAVAHEGHEHADGDDKVTGTATGFVFHDRNGNQKRDEGEEGLADIKVSNGRQIVKTDAQGKYTLPVTDDTIVFVIKPRNWMTPLTEHKLPKFYYIHKPKGSPDSRFPGVMPTGPLPASIDFPLTPQAEPDSFKALFFGDTQPRDIKEVEYIAHDVVEQVIAENAHGASFGVTLGDIVFDDLSVMKPLNQAIALIDIPWYNVLGNHDMNYDAADDEHSDETFESIYGPSYYSFDHGTVHFMVVDDVTWHGPKDGQKGKYTAGLGKKQMEFIRNDLAMIPENQLVVLMMHIPLIEVEDRQELYRLIEKRPFALSISAHTHYMEHVFIGKEDGWMGPEPHHHVINVTVCGSWWSGTADERGIPHATMSDGGPNGYSIFTFDGTNYDIEFRGASRPASYQMLIDAPERVATNEVEATTVVANVFGASEKWKVEMRLTSDMPWVVMENGRMADPYFSRLKELEKAPTPPPGRTLPSPQLSNHIWKGKLPAGLKPGGYKIEIQATDPKGKVVTDHRILWIDAAK
ncbi:MAG: calcineurin-like phosphoesterase family protein [Planctomycetes bacterium]|nr:calcineurin-like phosphoesterase family protein [Planctomycetota bacterium]